MKESIRGRTTAAGWAQVAASAAVATRGPTRSSRIAGGSECLPGRPQYWIVATTVSSHWGHRWWVCRTVNPQWTQTVRLSAIPVPTRETGINTVSSSFLVNRGMRPLTGHTAAAGSAAGPSRRSWQQPPAAATSPLDACGDGLVTQGTLLVAVTDGEPTVAAHGSVLAHTPTFAALGYKPREPFRSFIRAGEPFTPFTT